MHALRQLKRAHHAFFHHSHILIIKTNDTKISLIRRVRHGPSLNLYPITFMSSSPAGLRLHVHHLPITNGHDRVPRLIQSLRVHGVVVTVPAISNGIVHRAIRVYRQTNIRADALPKVRRVLSNHISLKQIHSIRVRSLLHHSPIRVRIRRITGLIHNGQILIAKTKNSVNDRLYHRLLRYRPTRLVLMNRNRGSVFGVRRRLRGTIRAVSSHPGVSTFVTSVHFHRHLRRNFQRFQPRVIFRTTTRGRIPVVRSGTSRTIAGGVLNARGLIALTRHCRIRRFIVVSASGTIGPAGVVKTDGQITRVLILRTTHRDNGRCRIIHFNGILNDQNDIMPAFGHRVTRNNPVAIARPSVYHCFVAVPRTIRLILRTTAVNRNKRIFVLSVNRPIGVISLTGRLVHLSNCRLNGAVRVIFANLHPKRGLCRRLFVNNRRCATAQRPGLFIIAGTDNVVPTRFRQLIHSLDQTTLHRSPTRVAFLLRRLMPNFGPRCRPSAATPSPTTPMLPIGPIRTKLGPSP